MARKIRLDQIDDVMREAIEDLVAATTLEWTVPSPPNFHTFEELPKVNEYGEAEKTST